MSRDSTDPPTPDSIVTPRNQRTGRVLRGVFKALASIIVVVTAVLVVGTFLPDVPVLGLATTVGGLISPLLVVAAAVGVVVAALAWRKTFSAFGALVMVLGLVAAAGGGVISARMIDAVERAGADIDVLRTLAPGNPGSGAADDEPVYLTDQGEDLRMNVYRPAEGGSALAPVLVYVHGGGWTGGSRADRSADMRWFADRGWLVMSVEYSLSGPDRHLWDVVQGQVGCALSWVGENAARYGGDAERLSLYGESAGGNLVLNTAYLQSSGRLPSACGGTSPNVAAVSTSFPGVDLTAISDLTSLGATFTREYTGGSPEEFPERYAAVNSAGTIHDAAPPTLILTGESDHLVPPDSVYAFADEADAAGIDVELVRVPHSDHGYDALPGNIGNQALRQLTAQWLGDHGQTP